MDYDNALAAGKKVYQRLVAQGRNQEEAQRDAERWVSGNFGIDVNLTPEPVPEAQRVVVEIPFGVWFGGMGSSTATTSTVWSNFGGYVTFDTIR